MSERIAITLGDVTAEAELNDSPCAREVLDALPIDSRSQTWGEEIYFCIGIQADLTDAARSAMAVGEVAYWPTGRAFCIFLGRTPASGDDGTPRAASDVEPLGRVVSDLDALRRVAGGEKVVLSAGP